jgi:hypothetical protein
LNRCIRLLLFVTSLYERLNPDLSGIEAHISFVLQLYRPHIGAIPDLKKSTWLTTILHDRFPCFTFRGSGLLVIVLFPLRRLVTMVHWEHLKRNLGDSGVLVLWYCPLCRTMMPTLRFLFCFFTGCTCINGAAWSGATHFTIFFSALHNKKVIDEDIIALRLMVFFMRRIWVLLQKRAPTLYHLRLSDLLSLHDEGLELFCVPEFRLVRAFKGLSLLFPGSRRFTLWPSSFLHRSRIVINGITSMTGSFLMGGKCTTFLLSVSSLLFYDSNTKIGNRWKD